MQVSVQYNMLMLYNDMKLMKRTNFTFNASCKQYNNIVPIILSITGVVNTLIDKKSILLKKKNLRLIICFIIFMFLVTVFLLGTYIVSTNIPTSKKKEKTQKVVW